MISTSFDPRHKLKIITPHAPSQKVKNGFKNLGYNTILLRRTTACFNPNSVPGKAIDYIFNRWTQLSQFLRQIHAPLDTHIVERARKLVIQVRKSSMFYKTLSSAAFASYVQSALYSAAQNEINPCDYMCALINNEEAVIQAPNAWLPWHYVDTLKQNLEAVAKQDSSELASPD